MQQDGGPVRIISRSDIVAALARVDAVAAMERAFSSYSAGAARVPPVAEILFDNPPGEAHIKAGHITGDRLFAVKVATGFYRNPSRGLASSSGLVTLFDAETGFPAAILLDEGLLTDIRTAAAGAVAAKYLAPAAVGRIAILGAGTQARLQARYLRGVTACRALTLWARNAEAADAAARDMFEDGFDVSIAASPANAVAGAQIVVTTTPAATPLLHAAHIAPGTHITAVGADSEGKQELAADIFAQAHIVATDSIAQAALRGDISHALRSGTLEPGRIVELGHLVGRPPLRRTSAEISVADLTGVATQDIEIAKAVLAAIGA
jgi:ornithine cyclodeaminase